MVPSDADNIASLQRDVAALTASLSTILPKLDRVLVLIDGDDTRDIVGFRKWRASFETEVRTELKAIKDRLEADAKERERNKNRLLGLSWGLGLTSIGSLGTLAGIIKLLFGG